MNIKTAMRGPSRPPRFRDTRFPASRLALVIPLTIVILAVSGCGSSSSSAKPTATKPPVTPQQTHGAATKTQVPTKKTPGTSGKATPKSVSLTVQDLPSGYKQTQAKAYTNTKGGFSQYLVTFTKAGQQPIAVKSGVTEYVNVKGSQPAYQKVLQQSKSAGYQNQQNVPNLGDEAKVSSHTVGSGSTAIKGIGVAFLQGPWIGTVTMTGPTGTFTQQQVIGYARTISANIKAGK